MIEFLSDAGHYVASFFVIISIIVFIHEYGHFWVARRTGVKVEAFSIGFGPELFGWNDKKGTRWKISLMPLGGYVKMFGDIGPSSAPDDDTLAKMTEEERKGAFHFKPLWAKAAVVAAGPMANFILAAVILVGFFTLFGRPETLPEIGKVQEGSAAEEIGLQSGDVILSLNGESISRFEEIRRIASIRPNEVMEITYQRDGETRSDTIVPKLTQSKDIFGNEVEIGLLGITSSGTGYRNMGLLEAIPAGVIEVYNISANTMKAIGQIITGTRSAEELSGVLRIGKYSGQATEQGISTVLWFMAVLSVNLGLINLFPIPVLDGGHLMYYLIEAFKGRPMAHEFQEWGMRVGFALLIMLMVFATYNDLKHFNLF